jgi:hypothetical protein
MRNEAMPCRGFEAELVRVLGLDHLSVRRLELLCEAGKLPQVRVDGYVRKGDRLVQEGEALQRFAGAYELTPLSACSGTDAVEPASVSGMGLAER